MTLHWRRYAPLIRAALTVAGLAYLFGSIFGLIPFTIQLGVPPGLDTRAYWQADLDNLYPAAEIGRTGAYLYSPAFAQALTPLSLLPFELVYAAWLAGSLAAMWWMRVLWLVAFPPVLAELYFGNVHIFYALAIVLGFRWSASWALMLLTKVTPGIGLLWFATRREWRPLLVALGLSIAIAVVSFALAPDAWRQWIESLQGNVGRPTLMRSDAIPLWARLVVAGGITVAAARTNWRWLVPVAVFIAMPAIWPGAAAVLVASASPRIRQWGAAERARHTEALAPERA
jgi:hypothetical protein